MWSALDARYGGICEQNVSDYLHTTVSTIQMIDVSTAVPQFHHVKPTDAA